MMNTYQQVIHKTRYARHLPEAGRREDWEETVDRYINFFKAKFSGTKGLPWKDLREAIINLEVMPSMRCMMTAGPALERDNVAGYNCSYVPVDHPRVFDEIMYILMCGTGVGFSVERQYINKLPEIAEEFHEIDTTITIKDSRIGWASGTRQLISLLYNGQVPTWDLSKIRPAGSPLRTFGGRASGPEPLDDLYKFLVATFRNAKGRKLSSIECHDIVCKVADVVVCGGVRRSALISLSNLTDERMRVAKSGQWWEANPQRALANNSVCYTEKPDIGIFMREWHELYQSKSGERGLFSRYAVSSALPERRDPDHEWGTNPCAEIILRPKQFCNLSEIVVRETDNYGDLSRKANLAAFAGTLQATLTNFRYLSSEWKKNTIEEALLGVSLTGIMDNERYGKYAVIDKEWQPVVARELESLRDEVVKANKHYAAKLGINPSAATTCVKPSGTVSQLVMSSSGIHPRYARYYVRRIKGDKKDPICGAMIEQGVPYEEGYLNKNEWVFSFPIESPATAMTAPDITAIQQLEHWLLFATHWCEHKPSVSIYVREHEWLEVAAWVYKNFDAMTGVSFFPYDDHTYRQAPYEAINEATYNRLVESFPRSLDLRVTESEDATVSSQELACTSGVCEL